MDISKLKDEAFPDIRQVFHSKGAVSYTPDKREVYELEDKWNA